MGESTNISWADSTHNEWIGCSHVSPGCERCYAEQLMAVRWNRVGWGPGKPRTLTSADNRDKPHAWNRAAAKAGERRRVFSASLSDWLDHEVPAEWLAGLLATVAATPALDWLLLSKRVHLWRERIEAAHAVATDPGAATLTARWLDGFPPPNAWLGATVEDQRRADERVPLLVRIPARVRFLSCEPLLEAVRLDSMHLANLPTRMGWDAAGRASIDRERGIHQIIIGGESQRGARPMALEWARALAAQARNHGVAVWVKQLGGHPDPRHRLEDLPEDLRIRELPAVARG